MSNIIKSMRVVKDLEGHYDVVTLNEGIKAYIVNCTARRSVQFNDPAEAGFYLSFAGHNHAHSPDYPDYPASEFAFRCIASLIPHEEPNNPIVLQKNGKIENIRIHVPAHHSLAQTLLPELQDSAFEKFDLYETGWQMPLSGQVREVACSIWANDFQGTTRHLWLTGKIYELLALVMVQRAPQSLTERACEKITQQPNQAWTISRLAKELATNECYLKQAFRDEYDMGVAGWIQTYRVELAKKRLVDSNQSITQIALDLGYQSSGYFSKVFKQYTHLTPKQFRQGQSSLQS